MKLRILETAAGLRNSSTRIPFRYGQACLTRCPQLVVAVTASTGAGTATGFAGDCLPPSWFDKSGQSYEAQLNDMVAAISSARQAYEQRFAGDEEFFAGWLDCHQQVQETGGSRGWSRLLASFGSSLWNESAVLRPEPFQF